MLRKAGRKQAGGSQQTLKNKIAEYNIDISHFTGQNWNKGKTKETDERIARQAKNQEKYSLEEVFKKDSPVTQHVLRGYIQRYNVIEYKCNKCGCDGHWQNGVIALEIDHIDGDNTNTNEWVKAWAYKQLRLVAQLFKIEKLYDYINVEFTHVGPENFDNYLIVFDIVSRKVLADSVKRFFGHLTVLAAIAGVVCACIFLI